MTTDELRTKFEAWFRSKFTRWSPDKSGGVMAWLGYQQGYVSRDAEVEALRKDAERYRWLRNNSLGQWEHPIVVSQTKREMGMLYVGPLIGIELDKDIDAAMRPE